MNSNLDSVTHQMLHSPACQRNQVPILEILTQHFPETCHVLEIASGTGQHADFFTSQQAGWVWQPSDVDADAISSIMAYCEVAGRDNFLAPITFSTQEDSSKLGQYDAALCCNMIHISPWESCLGLFRILKDHLKPNGNFVLYGPFIRKGIDTAPSNLDFDRSLKERDPSWGIRHLDDVIKVAKDNDIDFVQIHEMPANNLAVIFRKSLLDC